MLWIFGPPQSRIEQELELLPPVSIDEVRERSAKAMESSQVDYYGDDGQAEYRSMIRSIGKARSVAKLYDLLAPDTFESY